MVSSTMQKRIFPLIVTCSVLSAIILTGKLLEQALSKESQYQKEAMMIGAKCSSERTCYEEKFKVLARTKGLIFAEQTLYKLWDPEPTTRRCHLLAHIISKEALRKNPEKWEEYFTTVDYDTCAAGFMHGLMESYLSNNPNLELTPEVANELCSRGEQYRKNNCFHGIGHLLMLYSDGNIDPALDNCENMGLKEELGQRCYTGVFMEDSFPISLVEHGIRTKLPERHNPEFVKKQEMRCRRFENPQSVACWIDMAENFVAFHNDPQKVYNACFKAPGQLEKQECFLRAAGIFAIQPDYSSPDKLASVCRPYVKDPELYKKCIGRMISSLLYYSLKFIDRGNSLCSSIEEWHHQDCFDELNNKFEEISAG